MSKSDAFIEVTHAIRQFDEQLETTSIYGDKKEKKKTKQIYTTIYNIFLASCRASIIEHSSVQA
jgi:hypothetical protein